MNNNNSIKKRNNNIEFNNCLHVKALYDFEAADETEISVKAGQVLRFIRYGNDQFERGWSFCESYESSNGRVVRTGYLPTEYHSTPYPILKEHSQQHRTKIDSNHITTVTKKLCHRRALIKEVIKTEETYSQNLKIFRDVYAKEALDLVNINSTFTDVDYQSLFKHVKQILGASEYLLDCLMKQVDSVGEGNEEMCCIGKIFEQMAPFFKMYTDFINNYERAYETYTRLLKHKFFKNYLQVCSHHPDILCRSTSVSCDLPTLLILPIQRIPRYKLLLQEIASVTDALHEDYASTQHALELISSVAKHCDESKALNNSLATYRKVANLLSTDLRYNNFMQSHRRFIAELTVNICIFSKQNTTATGQRRNSSFSEDSPTTKEYQLYLFNDCIVLEPASKLISSPRLRLSPRFTTRLSERASVDQTGMASHPSSIHIVYLHFSDVATKNNSTTFGIDCVYDSQFRTILVKANDPLSTTYMQQFQEFAELVQDCVRNVRTGYCNRHNVKDANLIKVAKQRLSTVHSREGTDKQLQQSQANLLEYKKKLHTTADEICKREDLINTLRNEIEQLQSAKTQFEKQCESLKDHIVSQEKSLSKYRDRLSSIDSLLYGALNSEKEAFQRVFLNDKYEIASDSNSDEDVNSVDNDVYKGRKLRRRISQVNIKGRPNVFDGDYTGCSENTAMMDQLERLYGETVVLFSSLVHLVSNANGSVKHCRLVITNSAVYIFEGATNTIRTHIPKSTIVSLSVSTQDDNFFVVHCVTPHDFLFYSVKKTEIVEIIMWIAQPKNMDRKVELQVLSSVICQISPTTTKRLIFERTPSIDHEFYIDGTKTDTWRMCYNPSAEDSAFLSNKQLLPKEQVQEITDKIPVTLLDSTPSLQEDPYLGRKLRRRASIDRQYHGTYITLSASKSKKLGISTSSIKFCDFVERLNFKMKSNPKLLIITYDSIIIADASMKSVKRTIKFSEIELISVSGLNDNYMIVHLESRSDEVLFSDKKTEIIQILSQLNPLEGLVMKSNHPTFRKKNREYNGSFTENNSLTENKLCITGPQSFTLEVTRMLKCPMVVECMELFIEGTSNSFILTPDVAHIPCIKIPGVKSISAIIRYYALDKLVGYHVETKMSGSSPVLTSVRECESELVERQSLQLKSQGVNSSRFGRLKRFSSKVLDPLGQLVCTFTVDLKLY